MPLALELIRVPSMIISHLRKRGTRGSECGVLTEGATDCSGARTMAFFSPCGSQLVNLTERAAAGEAEIGVDRMF